MSDIEGKVTRVGANERGQRTSFNRGNGFSGIEGKAARVAATECGQRRSFKKHCCNFCKRLFLKAAIEEESANTLYAQSNQKTVR
jgi:hypothetical protein